MGGCIFRINLPINVPKYNGGEIQFFLTKNFQILREPTVSNLVYTLPSQTLWRRGIRLFKRETTTTKLA